MRKDKIASFLKLFSRNFLREFYFSHCDCSEDEIKEELQKLFNDSYEFVASMILLLESGENQMDDLDYKDLINGLSGFWD